MGCKQLCSCRNIFFLDFDILLQILEHPLLPGSYIILVYPPDNLDFLPVPFINNIIQNPKYGIRMQELLGKQQFRIILDWLEQERHSLIHVIAQAKNEILVQFLILSL